MLIIDGYPIDVAVSEAHELRAEVSSYPVESGGEVVDHRRKMPRQLIVEGVVSDTPIGAMIEQRNQFEIVNGEAYALPSDEAWARLKAIHEAGEPVTVETDLETYNNMVLSDLSIPRNRDTGDALRFAATFVEILFVDTERATVTLPRAKSKVARGNKPGKPIDATSPRARGPRALAAQLHDRGEIHDVKLCGKPH